MDTVTYPDSRVQQRLAEWFVPVKIELPRGGPEVERFRPLWTPCFVFLDSDGLEVDREMGYLPPADFLAQLGLGYARLCLQQKRAEAAVEALRRTIAETADSSFQPELHYWLGVARYKAEGKPDGLLEAWRTLLDRWPDSRWARSASFIR